MESVESILMRRDNITREHAQSLINECKEYILECAQSGDIIGAENAIMDYLGLEPDYLFNIIDF